MPYWSPGSTPVPYSSLHNTIPTNNITRSTITHSTLPNNFPNYEKEINPDNYKFPLDPWQKLLKAKVAQRDIKGLFILISPSGGKTDPIMEGLILKLLGFNTKFKILWSAPLKQLAYQLCNDIATGLFRGLLQFATGRAFLNKIIPGIPIGNNNQIIEYIKMHYIGVKTGEGTLKNFAIINKNTLVDITTFKIAGDIIKKYKYNVVVIDEMQEAFTLGTAKSKDNINAYINLFKYQQNKYMYLLSGTTHKIIAKNFINWVNKKYNTNIELFQQSYSDTRNRSIINIIPIAQLANYNKLNEFVLNILTHNLGYYHVMILFSKKQIRNYCEYLIKRIPPYINIPNMDIIFANSKDRLICKCLQRGFGYIVGAQPDSVRELDQILMLSAQEKVEVAKLFKGGNTKPKLKFLFATDAIGIGVNMKVKSLYIPSVKRFNGIGLVDTSSSSLVQLLHRAGRGSVPIATIYTTPQDIQTVKCHIESDPMVICINDFDVSLYSNKMPMDEQLRIKLELTNPCQNILNQRF